MLLLGPLLTCQLEPSGLHAPISPAPMMPAGRPEAASALVADGFWGLSGACCGTLLAHGGYRKTHRLPSQQDTACSARDSKLW